MGTELDLDDVANGHLMAERELQELRDACRILGINGRQLRESFKRECADTDQIIAALELPIKEARTECGNLNLPRILKRIAMLKDNS